MQITKDVMVKYRRLLSLSSRSSVSLSFLMALSWNVTDFIPEKKINNLQLEDPKVSVQSVDKKSSDGHFRMELNGSVCAIQFACWNCITNRRSGGGGGLMFALAVSLKDPYDLFGIWTVSG